MPLGLSRNTTNLPFLPQENIEALRFTGIAFPTTVSIEAHARGRFMRQHDAHTVRVSFGAGTP
jgi:hypothetical protein